MASHNLYPSAANFFPYSNASEISAGKYRIKTTLQKCAKYSNPMLKKLVLFWLNVKTLVVCFYSPFLLWNETAEFRITT